MLYNGGGGGGHGGAEAPRITNAQVLRRVGACRWSCFDALRSVMQIQSAFGSAWAMPLWQSIQVKLAASDWCMVAGEIASALTAAEGCLATAIAAGV
jgi:hypothetical protein